MKVLLNIFAALYMIGPLVIVPILAYRAANYYLLFGIGFSYLGSITVVSGIFKAFTPLFLLVCVGFWLSQGFSIYQYITFFFFCSLGGYVIAAIADAYHSEAERESSLSSEFDG